MSRTVPEWIAKHDDQAIPPRVRPLSEAESGRGIRLPDERRMEIEDFCWSEHLGGRDQEDICRILRASKSRVSRWTRAGFERLGHWSDRKILHNYDSDLPQKLLQRIQFDVAGKCWPWLGELRENGYGAFNHHNEILTAHRAIYELFIGPIPAGYTIDHRCENKTCVNPAHLEPVPHVLNIWRSLKDESDFRVAR